MKKFIITAVALLSVLSFSCSWDPIFATIETEEKMRKPTLENFCYSIVNDDDNLYACNGKVLKKEISAKSGTWTAMSVPSRIIRLASFNYDGSSYAVLALATDGKIYILNGSDWNLISEVYKARHIFADTHASSQKFYMSVDNNFDGTVEKIVSVGITKTGNTFSFSFTDESFAVDTIKVLNGKAFNTVMADYSSSLNKWYKAEEGKFSYSSDGSSWTTVNAEIKPNSLCFWNDGSADFLVIGSTLGGARFYKIESGVPSSTCYDLGTNTASTVAIKATVPGGIWSSGNNIYIASYTYSDSDNNVVYSYYSDDKVWQFE